MADAEFPDWTEDDRADGARIVQRDSGRFAVDLGEGRGSLDTCPCCGKTFPTARSAKLVADAMYPMTR
jgi:hypothetical protein